MILASASPRRRELLGLITDNFKIIPAKGEENIPEGSAPEDAVRLLAKQKAEEIYFENCGEVILAADTIVSIGGEILGKPLDEKHASEMLKALSGRRHSVFTGVCVIFEDGTSEVFAEETAVDFCPLSENEIKDYVASGEPMDKAGAYGIQGRGALFVKGIVGDYYNVMGLPVSRLNAVLKSHDRGYL